MASNPQKLPELRTMEAATNGQVRDAITKTHVDGVRLYGAAPAPRPVESPVATVTRWRDWRFSPTR